ncbi:DnaJ domain-containing protein [Microcoleus sp. ZQ-A2]|jgi:curved DNA-binding protein CbpA|nr:DnaJ domain-containing protein [Microcoleus sp. FACHB-1]
MSFQIERGLFKFDFNDHHAVIGVPVDADVKEVRKRYLKIARKLHPDSCKAASDSEKKLANQLLSKLVNPAYEQLSQGNNRDYLVSLGHMGRRLAAEGAKIPLASASAKQLFQSGANLDNAYKSVVQKLATTQYDSLDQVLDKIAEISELNMVYLMLSKGELQKPTDRRPGAPMGPGAGPKGGQPATPGRNPGPNAPTPPGTPARPISPLPDSGVTRSAEYVRRAEGYMAKNNFAAAVLELREALKLDPNNSRCHSLLGASFLKQNQATMAKVHLNKALQLNPNDELALKGKKHLDALQNTNGGQKPTPQPTPGTQSDQSGKSRGGGLFGGLFGGKKK